MHQRGLTTDTLSYKGEHFVYENVPIALRPLQQPHPPFWYGSSNEIGSTWAGEQGLHFVTLGPTATAKANIAAFREALAKRGGPAQPKAEFSGGAADRRAAAHLRRRHRCGGAALRQAGDGSAPRPSELAAHQARRDRPDLAAQRAARRRLSKHCVDDGTVIAGSPQTVRAEIERQVEELGVNYLLTYLFLGTMSLADALRSLNLFSTEVMPHLAKL